MPGLAAAEPEPASGGFALRAGSGGLVLELSQRLAETVDMRLGFHGGSIERRRRYDDIDYDAKARYSAVSLGADWRVFGGGFRLYGGIISRPPEIRIHGGDPDELREYEVGDTRYRGRIVFDGEVDLGGVAPMLGMGWGGTTGRRGFGLSLEAGVIFADAPDIRLNARGMACNASLEPGCDPDDPDNLNEFETSEDPDFQEQKEAEVRRMERDARDLRFVPVVSIGLHWRF